MNKALVLILSILFACGPGAEEKARLQKAREDSIKMVTETATRLKIEKKLALAEQLKNEESVHEGQENRLSFLKTELEVQRDKLNQIKQPKFLRTPAEREQQLRQQILLIEQLERDLEDVQYDLTKTDATLHKLKQELKNYE